MSKENYLRHRTRIIAAGAVVALALSACGNGDNENGEAGEEAASEGGSVTFNTTGGEFSDYISEHISQPFTEETGIDVVEAAPNDDARIRLMVDRDSVEWDVVHSDPTFAVAYCDEYAEPLDYDVIDTDGLPDELVSECAVPLIRPAFLLVYDEEEYGDNPPTGWADFFDTEEFPGSRGMFDAANHSGALEAAMVASGTSTDEAGAIDLDTAFETLDRIKDDITFFGTGAEMQEALESERVDMGIVWLGRAYLAVEAGASYVPVWDEAVHYFDSLMVVKGSPNKAAAMELINFAVSAGPQEDLAESTAYPPANENANPTLSDTQELFAIQSEESAVMRDYEWWTENLDEATSRWTDWATG